MWSPAGGHKGRPYRVAEVQADGLGQITPKGQERPPLLQLAAQVLREVQKVILGKREIVEKVLMAVLAQGHVLLDDVPGVGKTTLAMAFARALGLETRRVQFTPDTMPSDILGFSVYDKHAGAFSYQPGAVMTNPVSYTHLTLPTKRIV